MMCWCLEKNELSGCGSIVLELLHTLTMFSKMLEMGKSLVTSRLFLTRQQLITTSNFVLILLQVASFGSS